MSWIAEIIEISKNEGKVRVVVVFTDGESKIVENYTIDFLSADLDWLKRQIATRIVAIESAYSFADELSLGVFDSTLTKPPDPTQLEIDGRIYRNSVIKLRKLLLLCDLGVKDVSDKDITDLQYSLRQDFTSSYLDFIDSPR